MSDLVIPEDLITEYYCGLLSDAPEYALKRKLIERIARLEAAMEKIHNYAVYGCGTKQKDARGRQFSAIEELSRSEEPQP